MFSHHVLPAEPIQTLAEYEARGGGAGLTAAREMGPARIIDEVLKSGLRGRGGAGFPTGVKWRSFLQGGDDVGDRFVVANGAEGEPGTFKDRMLMRRNPYQVLEGLAIAGFTIGARAAYLALKASFEQECDALVRAFGEMEQAGWWDESLPLTIVRGPEEYLFGEEKGLLEVIEGEPPLPRMFPPYLYGLFTTSPQMGWVAGSNPPGVRPDNRVTRSNPTLISNAESHSHVPLILANGADWYRSFGTQQSPGFTMVTVCGDTVRADVAEVEMGTPLRDVIDAVGGGMPEGRSAKAVLSGVANPVLTADQLDAPMSYEGMAAAGAGLGACGFVVYDDTRNMIAVAHSVSRFLGVESCGQCPPCKLGATHTTALLEKIIWGDGNDDDVVQIVGRLRRITDGNRCFLGLQERLVISSLLEEFPDELAATIEGRNIPKDPYLVAKLVDVADGKAVLDEKQLYKQPDWTYAKEPVTVAVR